MRNEENGNNVITEAHIAIIWHVMLHHARRSIRTTSQVSHSYENVIEKYENSK